jgi:hypothetical protein
MAQTFTDGRELATVLQELAARSVSDQARALERYRELIQQLADGELSAEAVRAQYDRLVAEQSAHLARDVTAIAVSYYQSLIDLHRSYMDRLFDQLASAERVPRAPDDEPGETSEVPSSTIDLMLRGQVGDIVRSSFAITNKQAETTLVMFFVSDFAGDGGDPFRAPIRLDPPRVTLRPRDEQRVTLSVDLDPAMFAPGRYRGEILVRGNDDFTLLITIDVERSSASANEEVD